ncbi:HET domain containing protein [Hyaloscypha variabilis]
METDDESDWETISSGSTDSNKPNNSIPAPPEDNFYSPQNRPFYAQSPYKPLDPTQQQIRLLQFLPSNEDGILSFALLDNRPLELVRSRYTALSYCGGDPRKTKAVYVNEARFNAFANLEYTLREVVEYWRKNEMNAEEELLWVDQVCINQSDPGERSHQVGQMRDIYAAASRVLIALGTEDVGGRSGLGIKWVLEVTQEFQASEMNPDQSFEFLVTNLSDEKFQDGFIDFHQMIRSPWWQRGWIYQEFILASEAIFLYGGASVSWQDMYNAFYELLDQGQTESGVIPIGAFMWWGLDSERLYEIINVRLHDRQSNKRQSQLRQCREDSKLLETAYLLMQRKYYWKAPTGLIGWLDSCQTCQTSDPRDRIYAFLGLAHPQYNIIPDYSPSNTMDNLVLEVFRKVLEAEGTLDFLNYVGERQLNASGHYLDSSARPSWVPDLNELRIKKGFYFDLVEDGAIGHPKSTRINASIDDSGTILTVEGIRLDTIPRKLSRFIECKDSFFNTMRGLLVKWAWHVIVRKGTSLWWFPGSSFVAVLAPKESVPTRPLPKGRHWRLLYTSFLVSLHYERDGWAKSVTRLVLDGDLDGLLAMNGVTKEVIKIH